ncbi:type I pullulanase [Caldicellulosiruptor acetigenus]|uniref:type I pullulanase n=1 Tax=Caldicellulosiruptor acetigenus TaxID=301953 RepID=UPI00042422B4|nr:type I pullulanase [Caldicellulosiruptor acetigenus]WAM35892.1 type I pullulanase [Caldicellulosiruptor acetigenus]
MIVRAYIDDFNEIVVVLSQMVHSVKKEDFKVFLNEEEIDIERIDKIIPHSDNPYEAEMRGYEICEQKGKIRFVLKEGHFDYHRKPLRRPVFVIGEMNGWQISPEWEMTYSKLRGRYELIKDLKEIKIGQKFKFAEGANQKLWYPPGFGNDIVITEYFDRETAFTNMIRIITSKRLLPNLKYKVVYKTEHIWARPREILTRPEFFYPGELGIKYEPYGTYFRLWAPTAYKVKVKIFDESENFRFEKEMARSENGTWNIHLTGDLKNHYYLYEVWHYNYDEDEGFIVYEVPDPYSKASSSNSQKSFIFDPADTLIEGWQQDEFVKTVEKQQDAIIYEMHVRDFTIDETSGVDEKFRGKFLGLCQQSFYKEKFSTGLLHLKELGITHIHLLPISDFGSVDDKNPDKKYNWGYDPVLYQCPEYWYSTKSGGIEALKELRTMIKTLHQNGIGVVMDVVFNHTYHTKGGKFSIFDKIVPGYFYRIDDYGDYSNATGCGNEIATEKPMVRKFILDTIIYWTEEFHIDGFRFDLMGLIDTLTMRMISKEVRKRNPHALIYGEGWVMGDSTCLLEERATIESTAHQGYSIGLFNDRIRDSIRGDLDGFKTGYMHGNLSDVERLKQGIKAAIDDFAKEPDECVNYCSCHDNLTLFDKAQKTMVGEDIFWIDRACRLANAIILTSQGIAFLHGGVEFNRSKGGHPNTYNAGDSINKIDWSLKEKFYDTFKFYCDLIKLRKEHLAFRMRSSGEIRKYLKFLPAPDGIVAFLISYPYDVWKKIIVAYNPFKEKKVIALPDGMWKIKANDGVVFLEENEQEAIGSFEIAPISLFIAYQK